MGTILENIQDNEFGYDKRLIVKGAVEYILATCSHYLENNGRRQPLTEDKMKEINKVIEAFAKDSLRCICIAYKDLKQNEGGQDHDELALDKVNRVVETSGLTCIAIIGI